MASAPSRQMSGFGKTKKGGGPDFTPQLTKAEQKALKRAAEEERLELRDRMENMDLGEESALSRAMEAAKATSAVSYRDR